MDAKSANIIMCVGGGEGGPRNLKKSLPVQKRVGTSGMEDGRVVTESGFMAWDGRCSAAG